MRRLLTPLILCLTGCETTFQVLNAVDFSQTVNTARRPDCYEEGDPLARAIIGEHPSEAGVIAYGVAYGAAHYAISAWLDRQVEATDDDGWIWIRKGWHLVTIIGAADNVIHNHSIGLRPFSSGVASRCVHDP